MAGLFKNREHLLFLSETEKGWTKESAWVSFNGALLRIWYSCLEPIILKMRQKYYSSQISNIVGSAFKAYN